MEKKEYPVFSVKVVTNQLVTYEMLVKGITIFESEGVNGKKYLHVFEVHQDNLFEIIDSCLGEWEVGKAIRIRESNGLTTFRVFLSRWCRFDMFTNVNYEG